MRKKIIITIIVLLVLSILVSIGLYYLNAYYLPQVVKTKIAEEASKQLGALIEIGDIRLSLFKGIVIHNLNIRNKKDSSPILQANRVYASFLIVPFFKERKIIFPVIGMDGARLTIVRNEDNTLNVQNLIPKQVVAPVQKASKESLPPILVYRIDINNSKIDFLDKAVSPNIESTLKLNNIKAQLSPTAVNFNGRGALIDKKQTSTIKLSGSFQFKSKELQISSQVDSIDLTNYLAYVKNIPLDIKTLSLSRINMDMNILDSKISGQLDLDIKDTSLTKDKSSLSQANAEINGSVNIDLKDTSNLNYKVNITGLSANIADPQIPENTSIADATITLTPNNLSVQNMRINTLDTFVEVKGELTDFTNPTFNFNIKLNVDIATARNFLKPYITIDDSIVVDGNANVNIDAAKEKDKKDLSYKGSLGLTAASIKNTKTPYEINSINGIINFDQTQISWSDLSFSFMDNTLKSKAQVNNFASPSVLLEINGDKINLSTKINSSPNNIFNIEYFKGNYYNSQFNASGNISIKGQNDISADLTLQSQVNLKDLLLIPYLPTQSITPVKPEGILNISGNIKGNIKDIKSLNGAMIFTSDELKFYGLSLKELQLQAVAENQQIKIPDSSAKFYDGTITLNGLVDLTQEGNPCAFNLVAENIDLSKLKMDTPAKDKEIEGMVIAKAVISGLINQNILSTIKGQGQFLIKDGYLWEFNPLKKLGDFLFIPRYETLVFKEAKGDFSITDQKVSTDNLTLTSNIITLVCEGNIDFAGNLDFEIAPYPVTEESQQAQTSEENQTAEQPTPANILNEQMAKLAGFSLVEVKGTIQNPKIGMKMVTKEVVDKLKEGVKDTVKTVKDVFGLIFGGNSGE